MLVLHVQLNSPRLPGRPKGAAQTSRRKVSCIGRNAPDAKLSDA
jgi:hypothetical protein